MHVQSMYGVDLLHHHSQELIKLVLQLTSDSIMADQNAAFIHKDGDKGLPISVYSSVTSQSPVGFLLHVMFVCGKFETELVFEDCTLNA